jgi:O-antigen/teichoic acid export membrane protein
LFVLGLSVVTFIIGFQRALISTPYAILFQQTPIHRRRQYRSSTFLFQTLFTIIVSILFIVSSLFLYFIGSEDTFSLVAFLGVFFLGQSYLSFFKFTLITEMDVKRNFFFCSAIYSVTLILLCVAYACDFLATWVVFSISGVVAIGLSLYFYFKFHHLMLTKKIKYFFKNFAVENWLLGKWIVGSNIAFMFSSQMFPWLLLMFSTTESIAELGVIMSVTRILAPAIQGVWSFLLPKMSTYVQDSDKFLAVLKKLVIWCFIFSTLLVLLGLLAGELFVELIYSEKYSGLGKVIVLGFIIQGLSLINMPFDTALNALKRTDIGFKSVTISAFVAIVVGLPLTMEYEVIGALSGMIVSSLSGIIFRFYVLRNMLKGLKSEDRFCN